MVQCLYPIKDKRQTNSKRRHNKKLNIIRNDEYFFEWSSVYKKQNLYVFPIVYICYSNTNSSVYQIRKYTREIYGRIGWSCNTWRNFTIIRWRQSKCSITTLHNLHFSHFGKRTGWQQMTLNWASFKFAFSMYCARKNIQEQGRSQVYIILHNIFFFSASTNNQKYTEGYLPRNIQGYRLPHFIPGGHRYQVEFEWKIYSTLWMTTCYIGFEMIKCRILRTRSLFIIYGTIAPFETRHRWNPWSMLDGVSTDLVNGYNKNLNENSLELVWPLRHSAQPRHSVSIK